jgi:hypothetical protein
MYLSNPPCATTRPDHQGFIGYPQTQKYNENMIFRMVAEVMEEDLLMIPGRYQEKTL